LPERDVLNRTESQLFTRLCVTMGGRIGELRHTNQLSTGARNDIEQATEIAHAMVCDYGMSDLGPLNFGRKEEQIFLGREINQHRDYSEATAIKIDEAVRRLIQAAYKRAEDVITEHAWALEKIAQALLERESVDGAEVKAILQGKSAGAIASADLGSEIVPEDQRVIRPDSGPRITPGLIDGERPQPA
jgi:cell division protease FtsH